MRKLINIDINNATDDMLALIRDAGFDGVDLGCHHGIEDCETFRRSAEAFRRRLDRFSLVCGQVHLPFHDLFLSSEIVDESMDRQIEATLSAMEILGAQWGAYHPRSSTSTGYDPHRAMKDNVAAIEKYLRTAEKYNAGIAIENIPIFPDCPQYRFFSADYEDHIALVDALHSERVGICLDVGHLNLTLFDMEKVIERMDRRIKILHLHNNFRTGDMHITPAEGTVDWSKVMPALRRAGYAGDVSLEINFGANFALKETLPSLMRHLADCAEALVRRFNA